jgi:hypothetical protein
MGPADKCSLMLSAGPFSTNLPKLNGSPFTCWHLTAEGQPYIQPLPKLAGSYLPYPLPKTNGLDIN